MNLAGQRPCPEDTVASAASRTYGSNNLQFSSKYPLILGITHETVGYWGYRKSICDAHGLCTCFLGATLPQKSMEAIVRQERAFWGSIVLRGSVSYMVHVQARVCEALESLFLFQARPCC